MRRIRKSAGGFTLIELLGALAVGAVMVIGLVTLIDDSMEDSRGQQAGLHQSLVTAAASKYIEANYDALLSTATATTPALVDVAALKATNHLPASFNAVNSYGQTPCVLVLQPSAGKLDALVVTEGGRQIPAKNAAYVASNAGRGGGYIPADTPTTAKGAFNSWSVPLSPFTSRNCTGTAAGANHLATALFFDGPGNLSSDYLYRNSVPGHPELNQMNTPLNMKAVVTENTSDALCSGANPSATGRIAVDAGGRILSCQTGVWKRQSGQWKDPVPAHADLPNAGNDIGDVRLVSSLSRAFSWNGAGWVPLAVDKDGNLSVPGTVSTSFVQLEQTVVEKSPCSSDGLVARDAGGLLLSCQSGRWQTQASTELASSETDKVVILKSNFKSYPSGTKFHPGGFVYDAPMDWYYAPVTRTVKPLKNGLVVFNAWSLMDRELVSDPSVIGQFNLVVEVFNNDTGASIGRMESMSPIIRNDTAGISTTLSKALVKNNNGYNIVVTTGWSVYNGNGVTGNGIYHRSNFVNAAGKVVEQTPLETGWTMDLFY